MIDGDPSHTSTQVRIVAQRILSTRERPLIAHEVEQWIAENDAELWAKVSTKCYDYVRMILSLANNNLICKYKCHANLPGIDRRAVFYGIPARDYGEMFTQLTGSGSRKKRRKGRRRKRRRLKKKPQPPRPKPSDKSSSAAQTQPQHPHPEPLNPREDPCSDYSEDLFFNFESSSSEEQPMETASCPFVDEGIAMDSWRTLYSLFEFHHPFWSQFLRALTDTKEFTQNGLPDNEILKTIISKYKILQESNIIEQATNIICREVMINRELYYLSETLTFGFEP